MHLHPIDWAIALISVAICFAPALFFGKRSGKSTAEFFASGRAVPWWLAGLSMVATTFSSDTPNLVANFVRTQGVAGNWQWWAYTLTGVATVFFYARLWRRSGVLTDLEFYELRYSGKAASAVRGFRAVYLGFFFNCFIMATVNLAACKIAAVLFGFDRWQTLAGGGAAQRGLRGATRGCGACWSSTWCSSSSRCRRWSRRPTSPSPCRRWADWAAWWTSCRACTARAA